jgi:hypothetical protein
MANTVRSTSPDGRFQLQVHDWEARNSQWVASPRLIDLATQALIFRFRSSNWSLDQAEWEADAVVRLALRKFPGSHRPTQLTVRIDCASLTAWILPWPQALALAELETELEQYLSWDVS